jgi:hypothetical protein
MLKVGTGVKFYPPTLRANLYLLLNLMTLPQELVKQKTFVQVGLTPTSLSKRL